jgi:hypothetical protein
MMLKPIVVVGICILAVMLAIKDGRILRVAGLTGHCAIVETYADTSELVGCRPGKLEGRPDLSHRGCSAIETAGKVEYWRCPSGFNVSN